MSINRSIGVAASVVRVVRRVWVPLLLLLLLSLLVHHCRSRVPVKIQENECPTSPNCGPVTAVPQDAGPAECPTSPNCGPVTAVPQDAGVTPSPSK